MSKRKLMFVRLIMLLLLATPLINAATVTAQQDGVFNRIPASAFSAIELQPKSALAQPSFELVPHELIKVFGEKELGLDLLDITRATVVLGEITDPTFRQPPEFALTIEFGSPQTLSDQATANLAPATFEDKTAYSIGPRGIILVEADDRTLMLGSESLLKQVTVAETGVGKVRERLASMAADDHFKIVVMLDPIRPLIKQNMPPKSQVPPPFGEFLALPDLIHSMSYRANFSTNEVSELTIEANNEKDAKKIVRMIENGIELAKGAALSGVASQIGISPDYEEAAVAYADRLAEFLKNGLKPTIDGAKLTYDLRGLSQGSGASSTATIGILVGMLLPAVQQTREAARRVTSQNNLKQFALSALNYEARHLHFPMQANYSSEGKPLLSWRVHLLPYMEQQRLYEQFKLDEPWDSPHNIQLVKLMPEIFRNPNLGVNNGTTNYLAVSGPGTMFPGNKKIKLGQVSDGTSITALFVEANAELAVEWTKPSDWELNPADPLQGLGEFRNGGFNVVFVDGSSHFIADSLDPETWLNMVKIADGNAIDRFDFGR